MSFAYCGCSRSDAEPSPEEKAALDAQMQQDMEKMTQMMTVDPSKGKPPEPTPATNP
jgi:hypothetical protein